MYLVEAKLGKGGFGQVYVGRRAVPSQAKEGPNANYVRLFIDMWGNIWTLVT